MHLTALRCAGVAALAAALAVALGGHARAAESGTVTVYVLSERGAPHRGVEVRSGDTAAVTDRNGAARLSLPAGDREIVIVRDGKPLGSARVFIASRQESEIIIVAHEGGLSLDVEAPAESTVVEEENVPDAVGTVRGRVVDAKTREAVANAFVFIRVTGRRIDARTGPDGSFAVDAPVGPRRLRIIHHRYHDEGVEIDVAEGRVTEVAVELKPAALELDIFEVVAPKVEGGVAELTELKRAVATVNEILGRDMMSKAGDSQVTDAVKRATGLTVVGGRYVYVRGMGERYSLSLLNGSMLPSPEPERRVVPLDLFPVDVVESVTIQKTYSPDMPAEFGGGAVDIKTRGVPEKNASSYSVSLGATGGSTFREGLTYPGGGTDWLGFDDGSRALPDVVANAAAQEQIKPEDITGAGFTPEELEVLGEAMPNTWALSEVDIPPSVGVTVGFARKATVGEFPIGAYVGVSYDNSWDVKEKDVRGYIAGFGGNLDLTYDYHDVTTTMEVKFGTIGTVALELGENESLEFTSLLLRTTTDEVDVYQGYYSDDDRDIRATSYDWIEQMLWTNNLSGRHLLGDRDLALEWSYAHSLATRYEPDRKQTRYNYEEAQDTWYLSRKPDGNQRLYNDLTDTVDDITISCHIPLGWDEGAAALKVGLSALTRERDATTRRFKYTHGDASTRPLSNDLAVLSLPPEEIFTPTYIAPDGFWFEEITRPTDSYTASQVLVAPFVLADVPFGDAFTLNAGFRLEDSDQRVETLDLFSTTSTPVVAELAETDFLPALNVTWKYAQTDQLRFGYGRTVSRPDFRELSEAPFDQVLGAGVMKGNPELDRAVIDNVDFRWESYPKRGDTLSAGLFYKRLDSPIELVIVPGTEPTTTFQNAPSAVNVGLEFEGRRSFDTGALRDWYVSGNIALISSEVDVGLAGVATSTERPLQGQSPFVVNLAFGYDNAETGTSFALLYNVYGERITAIGTYGVPDVYEQPFNQLDLVYALKIGSTSTIKFKLKNILDDEALYLQGDKVSNSYHRGRSLSVSMGWKN